MAVLVSHKDWELRNSRIWLAEIEIESGLDFSHLDQWCFAVQKLQTEVQNHWLSSSDNIYLSKCQKADEKKIKTIFIYRSAKKREKKSKD